MISHLALIMDGNRRWAKKNNMFAWLGHEQGAKTVEMVLKYCIDQKISYVSLYTFSLENFKRSDQEVSYLFSLINQSTSRIDEFVKAGIQIRFVGNLALLPTQTQTACATIEKATLDGKVLQCNFLICYGGQQEILSAVTKIVQDSACAVPDVTIEKFKSNLWLGNIPDPEVIIRTGGIKRLSNFLLFQAAYSEIRFLDVLWPDLTQDQLHQTLLEAVAANKNFGA